MDQILKPIDSPESVFIYRDNQKFICTDYDKLQELLAESLFEINKDEKFMIDLTHTPTHPLMFEFSLNEDTEKNTFDFLNRFVDFVFIRVLQNYISLPEITLLQAMSQSQTKGLRIYVVGVEISHDDYLHLCHLMRYECQYEEENLSVYLESLSDFPLPSCDRPTGTGDLYMPARLVRVKFGFYQENSIWYPYRQEIVTFEQTEKDSFFGQIVNHPSRWKEMVRAMMPIPQPNATHLHFPTEIFKKFAYGKNAIGYDKSNMAEFKSYLDNEIYSIVKENVLVKGKGLCYDFLKNNANNIDIIHTFETFLLRIWHSRFQQTNSPLDYHFKDIDLKLKRLCPHLRNESSPLLAVLSNYERPVYFAICNLLRDKVEIDKIREQFPFLSKDLPDMPPKEASRLTFDTILYCAYSTGEGTIFNHLGVGFDWIVKNITTLSQLIRHVRLIQKRFFPVAFSNENVHAWDPNTSKWVTLKEPILEIENIIRNVVQILNTYSEIPTELTNSLLDQEDILKEVVNDIKRESWHRGKVEGNTSTELLELYGHNMPEYYFFDITTTE